MSPGVCIVRQLKLSTALFRSNLPNFLRTPALPQIQNAKPVTKGLLLCAKEIHLLAENCCVYAIQIHTMSHLNIHTLQFTLQIENREKSTEQGPFQGGVCLFCEVPPNNPKDSGTPASSPLYWASPPVSLRVVAPSGWNLMGALKSPGHQLLFERADDCLLYLVQLDAEKHSNVQ